MRPEPGPGSGNPGYHARQTLWPEQSPGAHHVRDEKDGGRHLQFLQDRKSEFIVVGPAIIESDGAGPGGKFRAYTLESDPLGNMYSVKVLFDNTQMQHEGVRCHHHAGFLDERTFVAFWKNPVVYQNQELWLLVRTGMRAEPRCDMLQGTLDGSLDGGGCGYHFGWKKFSRLVFNVKLIVMCPNTEKNE
jgi:hypothetical protein